MTETDFRVKHSELIEYYQLIEMRLKFTCAALLADEERGWFDRLNDYESDPFGLLLQKIKDLQVQKQIEVILQEDFIALDELRKTRNYWVHQCFGGQMPIVFRKGEVKNSGYAKRIVSDLNDAIEWDEKLTQIDSSPLLHFK